MNGVTPDPVEQVASALQVAAQSGLSSASLVLNPPSLGRVDVRLQSGPNGLVIRLAAERPQAADLLRSHLEDLRDQLAARQVSVAELHVLHNPPAAANGQPADGLPQRRPNGTPQQPQDGSGGGSDAEDDDPSTEQ